MTNGVFDTRAGTIYDDDISSRYHFPNRYLPPALACQGDWIVYREPSRNKDRAGYVAVAKVVAIEPDPDKAGFSYALVQDFLPFDEVVPLEGTAGPYEALVRAIDDPNRRGAALQGRSIRAITTTDFATIVLAGLQETLLPANARRLELDAANLDPETRVLVEAPLAEQERRIAQVLTNRKIRDAAFRRQVIDAYEGRCAVTGLRLINGGGKAEAQAAHIWPVAEGGPDIVQNGIALSATVHWLFDRYLISLTDELGLLVAHNRVPAELQALFAQRLQRIHLPQDQKRWPHLPYVQRHREQFADS